ncbi:MAG: AsmA-like C-terminal region-containing protein [Desulfomonilaceae bacterium]|jgi:hypothetical protein
MQILPAKPKSRQAMTFPKKLIIIILSVCLFAGVGLLLLTKFLPDTTFLKRVLENKINEATGRETSLGKVQVKLGFPSLINLVVKGIAIRDNNKRPLFTADSLRLSLGLWSIVTGSPSIENLRLSSAVVGMYRDSGGKIESVFSGKPEISGKKSTSTTSERETGEPTHGPESTQPHKETAPSSLPTEQRISWPIKFIVLESCQVFLDDYSTGSSTPVHLAFEKINGQIKREEFRFDIDITGLPNSPGLESSELATKGFARVSQDFLSVQEASLESKIQSAKITNLWFLPTPAASWFKQVELNNVGFSTKIEPGKLPVFQVSAGMFQRKDHSSALKLRASAALTSDFRQVEEIELKGTSEDIPVRSMASGLPNDILDILGNSGSIKTDFQGFWTRTVGWSVSGSAKLSEFHAPAKFGFLGNQLTATLAFKLTSDSFTITDFHLENQSLDRLMSLKGKVGEPLSERKFLDIETTINIRGEWLRHLGISLPKDFTLRGPISATAHLKGPLENLKVETLGDLSLADLSLKSVFDKEPGVKAGFRAQTVISLDQSRPLSIFPKEMDIKLRVSDTTIKLAPGFQPISGCPVSLDTEISAQKSTTNVKNLVLRVGLPGNKKTLLLVKGNIHRLNSKGMDLNLDGGLTLSREVIDLLGLPSKAPVDMEGVSNVSFRVSGAPDSLKWSFVAPLRDVRVSIGTWFFKKAGVELNISASGSSSPGLIEVAQLGFKAPGLLAVASGTINLKASRAVSGKLDLKEADFTALTKLFPSLEQSGLSGLVRADLTCGGHGNQEPINGVVQLVSVGYKPSKSPLSFDKITGTFHLRGSSLEGKGLKGNVHGTIEAPVTASLNLEGLENPGKLKGNASLSAGPGRLSGEKLGSVLARASALIEPFLNQSKQSKKFNPFELQSATADLTLDSGIIKTDNFRLKASELIMGAIGSVNLKAQQMDILSYVRTSAAPLAALGSIPAVKDIIHKNEGLLKIMGLDKELKKLGIDSSENKPENQPQVSPKKEDSLNVIIKIAGLWAEPTLTPVLENSLPKDRVNQLKQLVN